MDKRELINWSTKQKRTKIQSWNQIQIGVHYFIGYSVVVLPIVLSWPRNLTNVQSMPFPLWWLNGVKEKLTLLYSLLLLLFICKCVDASSLFSVSCVIQIECIPSKNLHQYSAALIRPYSRSIESEQRIFVQNFYLGWFLSSFFRFYAFIVMLK